MEEWISSLKSVQSREHYETAQFNVEHFSGMHNWYACSHARPTFCNVCRESLSGVTSHGLSCEGEIAASPRPERDDAALPGPILPPPASDISDSPPHPDGCHVVIACDLPHPSGLEATSAMIRPTRNALVCKFKAHKRCAVRAVNNCKWTTLTSIGKDIIEDEDGVAMPHRWLEGNLSRECPKYVLHL
uniref:Uncharacterized protein n=1 Tax=Sphaerodactylus townsendi TaxID=933632 RepID=A0ACB8FJS2_9SAUR